MTRKTPTKKRQFFHETRSGAHWAKVSVEWSEHDETPDLWKANAEAAAERAFMAADLARDIVDATLGKTSRPR